MANWINNGDTGTSVRAKLNTLANDGSSFIGLLPQGRLTLQSGSPIQNADQTGKITVYYDSYLGNLVPVWNGSTTAFLAIASDEVSMGLDASTPHVASGSLYDVFGINNSGTLVIAVGPAWNTTASRGTGAGTTELQLRNGIWTNKNSLTHAWGGASGTTDYGAVSANQATYLGTLYATANGQTGVALKPAAAGGGSNTIVGLFNAYNSVPATAISQDNTSSWTNASASWRRTNNNSNNRVSYVDGLANIIVSTKIQAYISPSANSVSGQIGVILNATTGTPISVAQVGGGMPAGSAAVVTASDFFYPVLGFNFVQGMEAESSATAVTFLGNGPPQFQMLALSLKI
jgi:hypothetical protein